MTETSGVRFARTEDGLAIPFMVSGHGFPFVSMPMCFGSLDLPPGYEPWQTEGERRFLRVAYDGRGIGQAPRGLASFTDDDAIRDLAAVLNAARVSKCILFATHWYGHPAIRFAAEQPERVAALVLFDTHPLGGGNAGPPGLPALLREDWRMFVTAMVAQPVFPESEDEVRVRVDSAMRQVKQSDFLLMAENGWHSDIRSSVPNLRAPTLVLASHSRDLGMMRAMVDEIPGAELCLLPLMHSGPGWDQLPHTMAAIDEFVGRTVPEALAPALAAPLSANGNCGLTPREREVLQLLASGQSNVEIAGSLVLSERTVARHIANVYQKIGSHNRAQATAFAFQNGLSG